VAICPTHLPRWPLKRGAALVPAIRETGAKLKGVGPLADVAGQAADGVDKVAQFFEGKQVGDVFRDVERFARREPAIFIGAAIGLSLPHTHVEDEWMGETKERLLHQAEGVAGDAIHMAEDAVGELTAGRQDGKDKDKDLNGKDSSRNGLASKPKSDSWSAG